MKAKALYIHALTPLHVGTGASVDVIDLPVAREKTTGWPFIPGSGLKGVLRDACKEVQSNEGLLEKVFGPQTERASEHAGAVVFSDAHLLCLPVRSFKGTFAWTTCPAVLARIKRDFDLGQIGEFPDCTMALGYEQGAVCTSSALVHGNQVYLEDLDVTVQQQHGQADAVASSIASAVFDDATWQNSFKQRFVVVSDDLFSTLTESATEVTTRVRIQDDTKTVQRGGLWYEEALPAESILWSLIIAVPWNKSDPDPAAMFDYLKEAMKIPLQIGGNASVGRGLVRLVLTGGDGK